jgi:D-alanyl-D-alanine endopeptidase (penicillin-binding protein 7)
MLLKMDDGVNRVRTGFDYETPRTWRLTRKPRMPLQLVLAVIAVGAFGSAWLLRDGASASSNPATQDTEAIVEAAGSELAAPLNAAATIPVNAVINTASDAATIAVPTAAATMVAVRPDAATADSEADAVQITPNDDSETPDEDVVDAIARQIDDTPEKKELRLPAGLRLKSSVVLVVDQKSGEVLAAQHADTVQPIASLTKLMTALVVTDAKQPMDEVIEITRDDIDRIKHSYSRLTPGLKFTRRELLLLALMSSENRAASALARHYPGGTPAFVRAMNARAKSLGMTHTHYEDSNGLSSLNVSTARDLVRLVNAAYKVPVIRDFSTHVEQTVKPGRRSMHFVSSNRLVRAKNDWRIGLQKTGYTNEAGRCLVMQATVKGRPLVMVLLDSDGKLTRFADAQRVRSWLEHGSSTASLASSSKSSRHRRGRARRSS